MQKVFELFRLEFEYKSNASPNPVFNYTLFRVAKFDDYEDCKYALQVFQIDWRSAYQPSLGIYTSADNKVKQWSHWVQYPYDRKF